VTVNFRIFPPTPTIALIIWRSPFQALHNYHLCKPPFGQFDVISLSRGTKFYNNQLTIHTSPANLSFKKNNTWSTNF
jgi:hypothetical protein